MVTVDNNNVIINVLTKALNTEIKYITTAITQGYDKITKKSQERVIIVLLAQEALFILDNFQININKA